MNDQQYQQFKEEMKKHVGHSIEKSVNGHIRELRQEFNEYVTDDLAWKERAEPVVKAFENTSWLFKLFVGALKLLGLMGTAGGVFTAIYYALKRLP